MQKKCYLLSVWLLVYLPILSMNSNSQRLHDDSDVLFEACRSGDTVKVKDLIDAGASVNTQNAYNGYTPLYEAACNGYRKIVELLIQHRAIIEVQGTRCGMTPIHLAALSGHLEIIKLLISSQFFIPSTLPLENYTQSNLQEQSLVTLLKNIHNFDSDSLKAIISYIAYSLGNLDPQHSRTLAIIADQALLEMQQEIIKLWKEHNTQESSNKLELFLEVHRKRYIDHLKNTPTFKNYKNKIIHGLRSDILLTNHRIYKFFDHITQAKKFNDLEENLRASIDKNIREKLGT